MASIEEKYKVPRNDFLVIDEVIADRSQDVFPGGVLVVQCKDIPLGDRQSGAKIFVKVFSVPNTSLQRSYGILQIAIDGNYERKNSSVALTL